MQLWLGSDDAGLKELGADDEAKLRAELMADGGRKGHVGVASGAGLASA